MSTYWWSQQSYMKDTNNIVHFISCECTRYRTMQANCGHLFCRSSKSDSIGISLAMLNHSQKSSQVPIVNSCATFGVKSYILFG